MTSDPFVFAHPDRARKRVLIVDDNPQVLQDLRLFLETPGELMVIGEASNGLEAIDLAQELKPEVIVMDLEMPVMNGYDAIRKIKSQTPSLRIVILSIQAGLEELQNARQSGADAFVAKGASYEVLLDAILGKS
jgi:two-component system nitrate/nitrite response regulator NarL